MLKNSKSLSNWLKKEKELYVSRVKNFSKGYVSQIGNIKADEINLNSPKTNKYFFADESKLDELNSMFESLIAEGNSVGAKLGVSVKNCPIGLGEPVFDKLDADLAKDMGALKFPDYLTAGIQKLLDDKCVVTFFSLCSPPPFGDILCD